MWSANHGDRTDTTSSQPVTRLQDTLDAANLDRMTAHRDAEKRCHRLLRLSWKRSTVRVRRFWLLRLLALGFLGLRPFLCIRLGRRLGLREATAHTTQHSHEHLITPLLTSTPTSAASMMRFMATIFRLSIFRLKKVRQASLYRSLK